jgi:hypothetical protein
LGVCGYARLRASNLLDDRGIRGATGDRREPHQVFVDERGTVPSAMMLRSA